MALELVGKLIEKFDEAQVSASFRKREFVIETSENNFTEQIKMELVQDRCDLLDPYHVGDEVKISFGVKGRKWNDKYFVNLQAWKIDRKDGAVTAKPQQSDIPLPPPPPDDMADDLPF